MRSLGRSILTTVVMAAGLFAAPRAQQPAFDVASVRPNTSDAMQELRAQPSGRLIATNVSLRRLIQRAYKLHDAQVIGAPEWVTTERYDIDARTAAAPAGGPDAVYPLLRPLLADRFMLRAHTDTRELPAFVLVRANRDGRLGKQIRPTEADCAHGTTKSQEEIRASALQGWPPCGMGFMVSYTARTGSGPEVQVQMRMRRSGTTMADFAAALQDGFDRPVVDGTGLEGRFDVEYTYAAQPPTAAMADTPFGAPPPTLTIALEEQLGLKLESRRATVPVLVIDGIEHPTAN